MKLRAEIIHDRGDDSEAGPPICAAKRGAIGVGSPQGMNNFRAQFYRAPNWTGIL